MCSYQYLQTQADSCQVTVAQQVGIASALSTLLGSVTSEEKEEESLASRVNRTLVEDRKLVDSVSELVGAEVQKVDFQRAKFLEVC